MSIPPEMDLFMRDDSLGDADPCVPAAWPRERPNSWDGRQTLPQRSTARQRLVPDYEN